MAVRSRRVACAIVKTSTRSLVCNVTADLGCEHTRAPSVRCLISSVVGEGIRRCRAA